MYYVNSKSQVCLSLLIICYIYLRDIKSHFEIPDYSFCFKLKKYSFVHKSEAFLVTPEFKHHLYLKHQFYQLR